MDKINAKGSQNLMHRYYLTIRRVTTTYIT